MSEDHEPDSSVDKTGAVQSTERGEGGSPWFIGEDQQTVISKPHRHSSAPPAAGGMEWLRSSDVGATLEGVQLEHFLLEKFVGGGGMGAVFRGRDLSLGREVAIKVVSSRKTDSDTLRRFRNEAQSAARLDHPNIARVYYVGEDQGWNFIVFEFIDGVNIRELVERQGPLSVGSVVRYTLHVAAALAHASERDVVHRDIKPSNILVTREGRAKLVDMGLARLRQAEPANEITESGVTLGTFDYISPEQARDPRSADVRSDLYSLGCTVYFMLTGVPPFPEGTVLQKLLSHSSESPTELREFRPDLNTDLAAIVNRLMAKQPSHRYPTPHELVADLLAVSDLLGLEGISYSNLAVVPPAASWRGQLRTHVPWLVPILLLFILSGLMHFVWRGASSNRSLAPIEPELRGSPQTSLAPATPPVRGGASPDRLPASSSREEDGERGPTQETLPGVGAAASAAERDSRASARGVNEFEPAASEDIPARSAANSELVESDSTIAVDDAAEQGRTLIVGSSLDPLVDGAGTMVPTLEAALERASELANVATIELRFDDREVGPLEVDLRRPLTIRAGAGYRPRLLFRPGNSRDRRRWMFQLDGEFPFVLEGVDIDIELPYEPGAACAMFDLLQVNVVSIVNSVLTIRNEWGVPAAFFAVQEAPQFLRFGLDDVMPLRSPSIQLEASVARGQASLVRALRGRPCWVRWEQGLFASSEWMVEASGLADETGAELIRIDLANLTAAMDRGLCRVTVDSARPVLPAIDIEARNCVVSHRFENPLVEHVGVSSLAEAESKFRYAGQSNYYESTEDWWRVVTFDGEESVFDWAERDGLWYQERMAARVVRWEDEYRTKPPVFQQTPTDYRLDLSQRRIAGFDESVLPPVE